MKFVTREQPEVDRIACPWLIKKFIDPAAELLFVPADQVMVTAEREGALPYDVPDVELGHHGGSSFESFISKYNLTDRALLELAKIVRAADTQNRLAAAEGEGLRQIANGWHLLGWSLEKRLEVGFAVYDCLYAVCEDRVKTRHASSEKVLFLCPHNAAKSVFAVAYFNQMAQAAGLSWVADSAGTEPDEKVSPLVATLLSAEGFDVSQHQPRTVTQEELQTSGRVISIGCTPQELGAAANRVEYWDDVPMVSQNPEGARDAIRRHVEQLVAELA